MPTEVTTRCGYCGIQLSVMSEPARSCRHWFDLFTEKHLFSFTADGNDFLADQVKRWCDERAAIVNKIAELKKILLK